MLWLIALAAASVAVTISWSKIFRPFRDWLEIKEYEWLHGLVTCYYCLGHWVVMFFFGLTFPAALITTGNGLIVDAILSYFALVGITSLISTIQMILLQTYRVLMSK